MSILDALLKGYPLLWLLLHSPVIHVYAVVKQVDVVAMQLYKVSVDRYRARDVEYRLWPCDILWNKLRPTIKIFTLML